jgi:DNA oxidative demethylase
MPRSLPRSSLSADLFAVADERSREELAPGAVHLPNFAASACEALLTTVTELARLAPFRQMPTPGGRLMSVEMLNCGEAGWVSDSRGYRYSAQDPQTGRAWPAMPALLQDLAHQAADAAGFSHFAPDVCLVNRYTPGTRLALHQDRDEHDFTQPIVSFSLGLSALFLLGGFKREEATHQLILQHGDGFVFGGPSRLRFHGVERIFPPTALDARFSLRLNLTFRKAR